MIWSSVFAAGILQGIFFLLLMALRGRRSGGASIIISALLVMMILTAFGYFVHLAGWMKNFSFFFVLPFGMMWLTGPLLLLYVQRTTNPDFRWTYRQFLHFIPYVAHLAWIFPLWFSGTKTLTMVADFFAKGFLPVLATDKIIYVLQDIHLLVYLFFGARLLNNNFSELGKENFRQNIDALKNWIRLLQFSFLLFALVVTVMTVMTLLNGFYQPHINYIYVLVLCAVVYVISGWLLLNPELINPELSPKYKSYRGFSAEKDAELAEEILRLMKVEKRFTDPELNLSKLAAEMGIPSYQLSRLVNEKFGKTFSELVRQYRVGEFIERSNQPSYQSFSVYGLALEVGFSSKSSFNEAFKKETGKTPSQFKMN